MAAPFSPLFRCRNVARLAHSLAHALGLLAEPAHHPAQLGTDLLDVTIEGPAVTCPDYGTIWSQQAQSYTQFVSFEEDDQAMMPPGNSEDADGDWFDNQQLEWLDGTLFPAPLGPKPPTRDGAAFTLTYASE